MKKPLFGEMFDFNDDGEADESEQTAELLYLESLGGDAEESDPDDGEEPEFDLDEEEDDGGDDNWETEDDESDWED